MFARRVTWVVILKGVMMRSGKPKAPMAGGSKPIRVTESTHATLTWLAADAGTSMQEVMDRAVEEYRRKKLLEATNAAYSALQDAPEAWAEIEQERAAWDTTGLDWR